MFSAQDHSFVICAYGESKYLEECIQSLISQRIKSNILIATSTPNYLINNLSKKYNLPLIINTDKSGIASDWNFAVSCVDTPLVTIAHQDDIYEPEYVENIIEGINKAKNPLIAFTDYGEQKNGIYFSNNHMLKVKRFLLKPLKSKKLASKKAMKRLILSFGNPICCPSVTYNLQRLPLPLFESGFRSNLDWEAWEKYSNLEGSFVYIPNLSMYHRVHEDSETSACIVDNVRTEEDYQMLKKFWPSPIAKAINCQYKKSQKSNGE